MKTDFHPEYFPEAKVTCACGATFTVGSTSETINVEICRECHPFYTGTDKLLDIAGRVEKFKQRAAAAKPVVKKAKKAAEPKEEASLETLETVDSPETL